MNKLKFVVDIGSKYISVYRNGLLLKELNIGAVTRGVKGLELIAAGSEAIDCAGNLDKKAALISPVEDGAIVNSEVAAMLIDEYLSRVVPKYTVRGTEIIAAVSPGLTLCERDTFEEALAKAGYRDVLLKENVNAALPYVNGRGTAVIIFGAGTTELAVVSDGGIIAACTVNIAGKTVDEKIAERILDAYNLKINLRAAQELKIGIGSLFENDTSSMRIVGRDILDGRVKEKEVTAADIRPAIAKVYKKILEILESLLTTIPPQMMSEVSDRGVFICGGGALCRGLNEYIQKYLKLKVLEDPEDSPETLVVRGLYKLYGNQ